MILIFYPKLTSDFRNFLKSVLGFKKRNNGQPFKK